MAKADLFEPLNDENVRCNACSHRCVISSGKKGLCGIRKNIEGALHLLTYGHAISDAVDPVEKKPLYHFLPLTNVYSVATIGCNFSCDFCQNADIAQHSKESNEIIGFPLSPEQIVTNALNHKCKSIAFTYTEPSVFFEYAYDTMQLSKKHKIKNVFVSNGFFTNELLSRCYGLLDGINIDLKSFNNDFYKNLCGARLEPVLKNIERVAKSNIWLEITTLLIPGHNDSEEEITQIAEFIAGVDSLIPWHISRFFPSHHMTDVEATPLNTLQKAYRIGKEAGLKFVYVGNAPQIGLENTFCHQCGTLLIKRDNYFVTFINIRNGKCLNCGTILPGIFT